MAVIHFGHSIPKVGQTTQDPEVSKIILGEGLFFVLSHLLVDNKGCEAPTVFLQSLPILGLFLP